MRIEEDRIIRLEVILMASSVQKILTNKSVTLGSAIGVGITAFQTVKQYKDSRLEGKGKVRSVVSALSNTVMYEAMGPGLAIGIGVAETLPKLAVEGVLKLNQLARSMDRTNRNVPFANATFVDTKQAYTMRQAGMQLAEASKYNLQQSLLGNEATSMYKL